MELALKQKGVLGARMTGAGFGGCTVNLVHKDYIDDFIANVKKAYDQETGKDMEIYVTWPAAGARELA